jgi:hypothetical protein
LALQAMEEKHLDIGMLVAEVAAAAAAPLAK